MAFSPDGRYLVTGRGNSGVVQVWDAEDRQAVGTLGTHEREIRGLVFSPDGRHLASASGDGEVKLWDATLAETWSKTAPRHTLDGAGSRTEPERGLQPRRPVAGDGR